MEAASEFLLTVHRSEEYGCQKAMKRRKAKKLPMKVQNMCFADNLGGIAAGTGTPGFQEYYINAAHIMSMMNRKAYHQGF